MIINGRFHQWDFQVYYGAAADWLSGGEVYGKSYGLSSGFYKYSLTALIPFVPFTLLPYFWASTLYYFGLLFLMIKFIKKWSKWMMNADSYWSIKAVFWMTLIFFGDHLERELFLGNINFLLLVLLMWFWFHIQFAKWNWAGWVLAFVCLVKPHFVIALPLIVLLKQWDLFKHFCIALGSLFLIPLFLCGPFDFFDLNQTWLKTMAAHNAALYESPNTLYGIFNPLITQFISEPKMWYVLLVLLSVGILVLLLWYFWQRVNKANLSILYFLVFALVPSLTHTDTEHFLFSMPLFIFIVMSISKNEKVGSIYFILMLAMVPFLFNSPDLLGKKWSLRMDEGGLGWANFLLIAVFFIRVIQGIMKSKAYIRLDS